MSDDKIVKMPTKPQPIRPGGTASLELIVNRHGKYCDHRPVELDTERRGVTCKDCGASLDPFDTLLRYAREHERVARDLKDTSTDAKGAHARLELLERLERNAKGRLRRLGVRHLPEHRLDWLVARAQERMGKVGIDRRYVEYTLEELKPVDRLRAALAMLDGGGDEGTAMALAEQALIELRTITEERK